MTFGLETPVFTLLTTPFVAIREKSAYQAKNISECAGPILTYFTGLVGVLVGIIIPIFVWQSPEGRSYGNQLNLGDVCRHHQERLLLFALAFNDGLAGHKSALKRLNGNNAATSSTNLVNLHLIISEFMLQFLQRFGRNLTTIFIRHLGLEDCNFDFSRVIGNHFYTSYSNLVRFSSATPEFKTKEVYSRRQKFFWGNFRYVQ